MEGHAPPRAVIVGGTRLRGAACCRCGESGGDGGSRVVMGGPLPSPGGSARLLDVLVVGEIVPRGASRSVVVRGPPATRGGVGWRGTAVARGYWRKGGYHGQATVGDGRGNPRAGCAGSAYRRIRLPQVHRCRDHGVAIPGGRVAPSAATVLDASAVPVTRIGRCLFSLAPPRTGRRYRQRRWGPRTRATVPRR